MFCLPGYLLGFAVLLDVTFSVLLGGTELFTTKKQTPKIRMINRARAMRIFLMRERDLWVRPNSGICKVLWSDVCPTDSPAITWAATWLSLFTLSWASRSSSGWDSGTATPEGVPTDWQFVVSNSTGWLDEWSVLDGECPSSADLALATSLGGTGEALWNTGAELTQLPNVMFNGRFAMLPVCWLKSTRMIIINDH